MERVQSSRSSGFGNRSWNDRRSGMALMVRSRSSASSRTKSSRRLLERSGPITRTFGGSASGSTSATTSGWSTAWRMSASETPWRRAERSEEHTSELQSLMRNSYAVFCLKKKKNHKTNRSDKHINKRQLGNKQQ